MTELTSAKLLSSNEENKKPKSNKITDQDIVSAMNQAQAEAFARYRELVKARREREKLRPREPEVYHHDIFKNS
jgi:hypothetical protein